MVWNDLKDNVSIRFCQSKEQTNKAINDIWSNLT